MVDFFYLHALLIALASHKDSCTNNEENGEHNSHDREVGDMTRWG